VVAAVIARAEETERRLLGRGARAGSLAQPAPPQTSRPA
jgi:hypothetical protein